MYLKTSSLLRDDFTYQVVEDFKRTLVDLGHAVFNLSLHRIFAEKFVGHNIVCHFGLHFRRWVSSKRSMFRNRPSAGYPTLQFVSTCAFGGAAGTADS